MCKEAENWIEMRIGEARRAQAPTVTDAVAIRMTRLLKGKLGEVPLTARELADTSRTLIADMATPVAPDVHSDHEN